MIKNTSALMIAWEFLFSMNIMYTMITVPLLICFPHLTGRTGKGAIALGYINELMWMLQIVLKLFTADLINGISDFSGAARAYFRSGLLFFDLFATIPSSILLFSHTKEQYRKFFMLLRFSHWNQFFFPFLFMADRYINVQPVVKAKYMTVLQVFMFILILGHFMACMWILLGNTDTEDGSSWRPAMEMPDPKDEASFVWATAFYFMFEVYSTVGYGEMGFGTSYEYIYLMLCMFIGVAYMSVLLTVLAGLFDSYDY